MLMLLQVICSLTNSTFNQDAFSQSSQALVFTTSAGDDSNLELTSLLPQVQYECQVKALLGNEGYGFSSSLLSLWTKPECGYTLIKINYSYVDSVPFNPLFQSNSFNFHSELDFLTITD